MRLQRSSPQRNAEASDEELVLLAQRGDRDAFGDLAGSGRHRRRGETHHEGSRGEEELGVHEHHPWLLAGVTRPLTMKPNYDRGLEPVLNVAVSVRSSDAARRGHATRRMRRDDAEV